ncbi:hypothetical protein [Nocardia bhagyanarayanae]|uniref:Uncharacterized protein n=1 Tax=Nocardia bhagyanarayanae TaxID=1215925 RepID=A0A543FGV6_9NOCA|nr:hypothetical protein [Nocardia bhagyanarayanae]TQM33087.1 hypothetical protein FB390_4801 [Nocardia bhagyanarayanae]
MLTATIVLAILGFGRRWFRRDGNASNAEGQARRTRRLDAAALRRFGRSTIQRPVPALSAAVALLGVAVAASAIAQC